MKQKFTIHSRTDVYLNLDECRYEFWKVTQRKDEMFHHCEELVSFISFYSSRKDMAEWLMKVYNIPNCAVGVLEQTVRRLLALWEDIFEDITKGN